MFVSQKLRTEDDRLLALLDASAEKAQTSALLLVSLGNTLNNSVVGSEGTPSRLNDKGITEKLHRGFGSVFAVLALKDLHELLEKVIDRCRHAGNLVVRMARNSA